MLRLRSTLSATIAGAALLGATTTPARADGRTLFSWSGTVDREAIIVMRGAFLETQGDGFESFREAHFRISEALPRASGTVSIARADGRGDVEVIQQPSLFNGYTTRVRVRDRQSGADRYRLVVTWQGAGEYGRRGGERDDRGGWGRDGDDQGGDDRGGYGRGGDDRGRNGRDGNGRDGNGRDGNGRDGNGRDGDGRRDDAGTRRDAGALRWSGEVDDVAEIRIQGRRVEYVSRSGRPLDNVRFDVRGFGLPTYDVPLDLRRFAGRGNVVITQYPRAWNTWTAVIRIDDSRGGADAYDFDLRW